MSEVINTIESETEIWKMVPSIPIVECSSFGRVRTLDRWVPTSRGNGKRLVKGHILKQYNNGKGYLRVHSSKNGKTVDKYVHRLVAETFIPNPNNYQEINHRDNNPLNNSVFNLEWCTHEYNIHYREKYGKSAAEVLGHPMIAVNLETTEVLRFKSRAEASRSLGFSASGIGDVLAGRIKQTHGYWFNYTSENAMEATRSKFGDKIANKVAKMMEEM